MAEAMDGMNDGMIKNDRINETHVAQRWSSEHRHTVLVQLQPWVACN